MSRTPLLKRLTASQLEASTLEPVDSDTLKAAAEIVDSVRRDGDDALRQYIERFEARTGDPIRIEGDMLAAAFGRLSPEVKSLLERTASRIRRFAQAQRECLTTLTLTIPGGVAGHELAPVRRAACYAPGGRFPLPSSVLMTAITAREAGVNEVFVITPSAEDVMLGAAFVAGADAVIWCGGAHGIAAAAYGTDTVPMVDVIVGPGNRWVTAAKSQVSHRVGIDMLAGPSELVIVADGTVCPELIAKDLLGQAEHDPDARPILVTMDEELVERVNVALERELATLETAAIARRALGNGGAVLCDDLESMVETVNSLAPEHLEVMGPQCESIVDRFEHYGGLFLGSNAAEVLGDYGCGPNHVLPTGGSARYTGGLSVFNFIRVRTWMRIERLSQTQTMIEDAMNLASLEGLEAHRRSAEARQT